MPTIVVLLALLGVAQTPIAEADYGVAGTNQALEQRLFAEAARGRLDEFSPLAAALVASGAEDADSLHGYEQKAAELAGQWRRVQPPAATRRQQVAAVFEFMHRHILRGGYDLGATDLRQTLDAGRYNCLSATVLFDFLAGQLGIDCRAVEMPHHVVSRVRLPDGAFDIETTCPTWFLQRAEGGPPAVGGREVSPIQLAAMIYYNRGVELLAAKRFREAAVANANALRLDPQNSVARGNLLATLNNWSIVLGDAGRYAEAAKRLRQGLTIDPKFAPLAQNYAYYHCRWAEQLSRAGEVGDAIAILSRAAREMPDREELSRTLAELRQRRK
jgi:tetratricopeptide (TPR) repeat protein